MPRKKIHKEKTRKSLEALLTSVGVTDRSIALNIRAGLVSNNAIERTKALELAARWRGFADVDKKAAEEIKHLPISNINELELDRLANRCAYCKHKKFEPLHKTRDKEPMIPELPIAPGSVIETDNINIEPNEPTAQETTD